MHHSFIDKYSGLKSPLHHLDTRIKILATLIITIGVVITPLNYFFPFIIYAVLAVTLWIISRIPFTYLLSRLSVTLPFVAIMTLGIAMGSGIGGAKSWLVFLHIIIRAALALTFLTLLTSTTPFPKLLEGLRWFKMPKVIHSLLVFIYRFIYIIIDEFQRLNRGRKSREFGQNLGLAWKARASMIGTFLIRSIERSERVYQAMLARGYSGEK